MKHTLLPLLCRTLCLPLCLALFLPGCTADSAPAYDPDHFTCTLSIDSVSTGERGVFLAEYVRDAGETVLTITAPQRLAGLSFTISESRCVLDAAGTAIPLSGDAASSLTGLVRLLGESPSAAPDRKKTADGTLLFFPNGQLTLDSTGLPVLAETTDGRRAAVTVLSPTD